MKKREIMGKERTEAFSTKAKYKSTIATDTKISNLAKKVREFSIIGVGRGYFNKRS